MCAHALLSLFPEIFLPPGLRLPSEIFGAGLARIEVWRVVSLSQAGCVSWLLPAEAGSLPSSEPVPSEWK